MLITRSTAAALCLIVCLLGGSTSNGQSQTAKPTGDGLVRTELSLSGRTVAIAIPPDFKAPLPLMKTRAELGAIEITGHLRIGTIDLFASAQPSAGAATPTLASTRYTLWSESSENGWMLDAVDSTGTSVGSLTLNRRTISPPSPTLVAALTADDFAGGRLVLRWGTWEGSAPVEFVDPLLRRPSETPAVNQTINRRHDDDTSALSRARLLQLRNESAMVTRAGARVSISFHRSFPASVPRAPRSRGLTVDRQDFARLATTPVGGVVLLTEAPVPRLRTEVPLRFGKTPIVTGNQVVGFPGSYGLWLKRVANGWHLVFNQEPDAWGSQHDPKFDAAEIDLTHSEGHAAARPFALNVIPQGSGQGQLQIIWGPHEWVAPFTY